MPILSLKRWERVSYEAAPGVEIHMKLKRLRRHEAKPLTRVLVACFEQLERAKVDDITPAQKAAIISQAYDVIPEEQLKGWFSTCVKDVEGLEIDGEAVTGGADLLDNADDQFLFWLLVRLSLLSKLSSAESNASASPSGSLRLAERADGSSPAQSTGSGAGPQAKTAQATPTIPASSSAE